MDPHARATATELVQAVMALHAAALQRILELNATSSSDVQALASDELISSVLVLHGLHPDDIETRVRRAFDLLRQHFDSRGGRIELLEMSPESIRLRVSGRAAAPGNKEMIENTISQAAPEIETIVIEGLESAHDASFVPLADLAVAQSL